jgi:hypothetical protein
MYIYFSFVLFKDICMNFVFERGVNKLRNSGCSNCSVFVRNVFHYCSKTICSEEITNNPVAFPSLGFQAFEAVLYDNLLFSSFCS